MNRRRLTLAIASVAALAAAPVAASASASSAPHAQAAVAKAAPHHVTPMASNGYQFSSEMNRGLCLTAAAAFDGALVDTEGCSPGNLLQQWIFGPNGNLKNAANPNLCLDDRYNNPGGGAATDLWDCNPWPSQYFTYDPGQHELVNSNHNCVDITDANGYWGADAKLFPCKGVSNQHWWLQ